MLLKVCNSAMFLAGASFALGACSNDVARAGPAPSVTDTSIITSAASRAPLAGSDRDAAAPPSSTASADTSRVTSDSAAVAPVQGEMPRLPVGRKPRDQTSYNAAIRAGRARTASWPNGPAAAPGALLPGKRIVAYYGNPHSKKMGVIGEYPEAQMLGMLDRTVREWNAADPATPVVPAIHLVTVVAQGAPGADGMWRRREDASMIEKTYAWAKSRKGVLFLDIQASHSTLQKELPPLLTYLERPDVHLGVDPEFYMHYDKEGARPSSRIGQMMASDINYVIRTLDKLVTDRKLPPKVLVVHRFTRLMVPDAESIRPTRNVQVVMHMDGWGPPWLKFDSYAAYIVNHPVQFTGFKLFYHNDTKKGDALLTPRELLKLSPALSYIQYQ
ncbi:MAG: hypothetical protein H7305_09765 [Gemmatimonadaceae bacterium]|nr:hypothetical protein [Gemmatimonadaceae bacterium]